MEIRSLSQQQKHAGFWSDDEVRQALELLKYDPLFDRIPAAHRLAIAEDAISVGRAQAAALRDRYRSADPIVISKEMGLRIVYDISSREGWALKTVSSYRPKPPSIVLHEASLKSCRERLEKSMESAVRDAAKALTNICVAHELFHHLERAGMCFVNLGYRVTILDIRVLKIEKSLTAPAEIAAHSFAQALLGLPFLPCALNPVLFAAG